MNITDELVTHMTTLVTNAFTSLASLIASPIGGMITFAIAIGLMFYVKGLSNVNHAKA